MKNLALMYHKNPGKIVSYAAWQISIKNFTREFWEKYFNLVEKFTKDVKTHMEFLGYSALPDYIERIKTPIPPVPTIYSDSYAKLRDANEIVQCGNCVFRKKKVENMPKHTKTVKPILLETCKPTSPLTLKQLAAGVVVNFPIMSESELQIIVDNFEDMWVVDDFLDIYKPERFIDVLLHKYATESIHFVDKEMDMHSSFVTNFYLPYCECFLGLNNSNCLNKETNICILCNAFQLPALRTISVDFFKHANGCVCNN